MNLAQLFTERDRLDGSKNCIPWFIKVKNLLKLDEVWDELGFNHQQESAGADGADGTGAANGAAGDEDTNVPRNAQRNVQLVDAAGVPLTPREIARKKVKAKSILVLTVKDRFLATVDKFDDPVECWHYLKQRFGAELRQRQLLLQEKLQFARMTDGVSVEEYITQIDNLAGQLASINAEVDEVQLMQIVLTGLPRSWSPFVSIFAFELSRTPRPSYTTLVQRLQTEDYRRKSFGRRV